MARQVVRHWDARYKTLALCALWRGGVSMTSRSDFLCTIPMAGNFPRGLILMRTMYTPWSIRAVRQDPSRRTPGRSQRRLISDMLQHATLAGAVWPETPRHTGRSIRTKPLAAGWRLRLLRDPLTWAGLERARISLNTQSSTPASTSRSRRNLRAVLPRVQHRIYADHIRRASERYAAATAHYSGSFWRDRRYPPPELAFAYLDDLQTGIDALNKSTDIRLRNPEVLQFEQRPVLLGDVLAIATVPTLSGLPPERQQFEGVSLPDLAALARENHTLGR